jgi:hypothetical protein
MCLVLSNLVVKYITHLDLYCQISLQIVESIKDFQKKSNLLKICDKVLFGVS